MGKKKNTNIPLPDDTDSSFEEEHFTLTFRPHIEFVEPEQEDFVQELEEETKSIDSLRDRTKKLINGLEAAVKLADLTQKRIDDRVKSSGGMTVKLDSIKDAVTIAAMKRQFPKKADPTKITYDDYKQVLDCINKHAPDPPVITVDDMRAAQADPTRTNFGGINNQQGENRAEISSPASSVKPLDLAVFQKAAVLGLFALMYPLIKGEDKAEIIQHKIDTPHK